jgi:hypothetical protein
MMFVITPLDLKPEDEIQRKATPDDSKESPELMIAI